MTVAAAGPFASVLPIDVLMTSSRRCAKSTSISGAHAARRNETLKQEIDLLGIDLGMPRQ
jgi:hypothetical protein